MSFQASSCGTLYIDIVTGMRFGQFGREDGALIMVSQSGSLSVKILKRNVNFEVKDSNRTVSLRQVSKLNIPKKTVVFVDQTTRERENATMMHHTFQQDLLLLRLKVAQMYSTVLTSRMLPITCGPESSLKVSAQYETHNTGPWENYTRQRARTEKGDLFVITGVAGELEKNGRCTVPKYFYKILVWCENGVIQAEYIYSLHSVITNEMPPETRWGSTSRKELSESVPETVKGTKRSIKTVLEVEKFIETETKIKFEINASDACQTNASCKEKSTCGDSHAAY